MTTKVTQQMLADAANTAERTGEGIAGQLANLLTTIQSQGAASFVGTAGTSFQNVSTELSGELKNLLTALNTMAENVHASNLAYGSGDEQIAQEITQVGGAFAPGGDPVVSALRGA
jgi:WXG100 family type VII secretion target